MAKKQARRSALTKKELEVVWVTMARQEDRWHIVIAAALVEEGVKRLLRACMLPGSKPPQHVDACTDMARAFGLISVDEWERAKKLASHRNAAAHTVEWQPRGKVTWTGEDRRGVAQDAILLGHALNDRTAKASRAQKRGGPRAAINAASRDVSQMWNDSKTFSGRDAPST